MGCGYKVGKDFRPRSGKTIPRYFRQSEYCLFAPRHSYCRVSSPRIRRPIL